MRWLFILAAVACTTGSSGSATGGPSPGSSRAPQQTAPPDGPPVAPTPEPFALPVLEGPGRVDEGVRMTLDGGVTVEDRTVAPLGDGFVIDPDHIDGGVITAARDALDDAMGEGSAGPDDAAGRPSVLLAMDPRTPVETVLVALRTVDRAGIDRVDLRTRLVSPDGIRRNTTVPVTFAEAPPDGAAVADLQPRSLRLAWGPTSMTRVGTGDVSRLRKTVTMARDKRVVLQPAAGVTYDPLIMVIDALLDAGATGVVVVPGEGLGVAGAPAGVEDTDRGGVRQAPSTEAASAPE